MSSSFSRIPSKTSVSRLSRIESGPSASVHEHSSLLFSHLDKVLSTRSIGTLADESRYEPHPPAAKKSSFTQSTFNSINILIGIGILALPLGFKASLFHKRRKGKQHMY
jgi:vesicular inhibitory amino acid transporter